MTFSDPGESKIQLQTGKPFENSAANKRERKTKKGERKFSHNAWKRWCPERFPPGPKIKTSPLGCKIRADHSFSLSISLFFFHQSLSLTPPPTPQAQTLEKGKWTLSSFGSWWLLLYEMRIPLWCEYRPRSRFLTFSEQCRRWWG